MSLNAITRLGDDALANQYELVFAGTIPGSNLNIIDAALRVTSFSIPAQTVGTYEVHYKTQKITKPSGKIETPNEWTFNYRVDKNLLIYQGFKDWLQLVANHDTGIMSPDFTGPISSIRIPVQVLPVDSAGTITGEGWVFEGCWISEVGGLDYDVTSGDPLESSVTLQFLKMI